MKILYYDCFSGISGDMNLGALLDLGLDFEYLKGELKKLPLSGYEIKYEENKDKGIRGIKFTVEVTEEQKAHRHLRDIEEIINSSDLNETIKENSLQIFQAIAEAEAHIHAQPIEKVHFHEVGAIDSIIDIVGAAIAFDYFKPDLILAAPVETGTGFVRCDHGLLPVPAPATLELLKGIPLKGGKVPFEATTPTGAAILKVMAHQFTEIKEFKVNKIGYGLGSKKGLDTPNALRVYLAEGEKKTYPNI